MVKTLAAIPTIGSRIFRLAFPSRNLGTRNWCQSSKMSDRAIRKGSIATADFPIGFFTAIVIQIQMVPVACPEGVLLMICKAPADHIERSSHLAASNCSPFLFSRDRRVGERMNRLVGHCCSTLLTSRVRF